MTCFRNHLKKRLWEEIFADFNFAIQKEKFANFVRIKFRRQGSFESFEEFNFAVEQYNISFFVQKKYIFNSFQWHIWNAIIPKEKISRNLILQLIPKTVKLNSFKVSKYRPHYCCIYMSYNHFRRRIRVCYNISCIEMEHILKKGLNFLVYYQDSTESKLSWSFHVLV